MAKSVIITLLVYMHYASIPAWCSQKVLTFAQSAVFSGPAKALGEGMRDGIQLAFEEANAKGGVQGYSLKLSTKDDGYEPDLAIENVTAFTNDPNVFAIIGAVGTPTSKAAQPIATNNGTLFIGPFTGAEFLRKPFNPKVVNIRASYFQEAEAWTAYAVDTLGYKRIALLYQDDSFGRAGLTGVQAALKKRGLTLVSEGTYTRNTTAVKSALLKITRGHPEAIFMVGAYKPCATFIKLAKKLGTPGPFFNISFVGSNALAHELGRETKNVIISQVMPLPTDTSLPIVTAYRHAIEALMPHVKPGFVSLEGYILGRLIIDVLAQIKGPLTPAEFEKTLYEVGTFHLGGLTLTFAKGDNQGLGQESIRLTKILPHAQFAYVTDQRD